MFDTIKDIYMAKLELAKLEGVERVSNVLATTFSIFIQIIAGIVGVITTLLLATVGLGYMLNNYILGITVFGVILILMVLAALLLRKRFIIQPLKDLIIKSLYEDVSSN